VKTIVCRVAAIAGAVSAEKFALILAVGLVLGTFPVFGCPTVLCLIAALAFRLNIAALQAVNQLSSPLQIALLIPLTRVGWRAAIAPGDPVLWKLGAVALQAVTGWLLVCVPLGVVLYFALAYGMRRRTRRICACQ
jgi:Uncharacterized protein conserved in bacteria (DUF2062)